MRIAIASGKGGTGKTTLATNLAYVASRNGRKVAYLDCDVEEPNGHLFLKPRVFEKRRVCKKVPQVDLTKCTFCEECERICQFNAIFCFDREVRVYPELCHACGGCTLVCESGAITESFRETGWLEFGEARGIVFAHGLLNVGEPVSPPLVSAVRLAVAEVDLEIIDAPPGTSCPVIASLRDTDYVVLVTEPTPFGFHDLTLAIDVVRALKLPFGVVVNRSTIGTREISFYCESEGIKVLSEIPHDRKIAEAYSNGDLICEVLPEYRLLFNRLLADLTGHETTTRTGFPQNRHREHIEQGQGR